MARELGLQSAGGARNRLDFLTHKEFNAMRAGLLSL